jgi:hypothetical protein
MVPVALLLVRSWDTWRWVLAQGLDGERRLLARADVRRGLVYSAVLLGNTAVGALAAAGLLPVPPVTAAYAALGSSCFGLEAWLEVLDLKRLERERARRDRRATDPPRARRRTDRA